MQPDPSSSPPAVGLRGGLTPDTPWAQIDPRTGQVCWNPARNAQKWMWIGGVDGAANFPVTIPAGRQQSISYPVSPEGPKQGDCEVGQFDAVLGGAAGVAARFLVLLRDSRSKRQFSNVPVMGSFVYGVASFPGALPCTIYVPATNELRADITNLDPVNPMTIESSAFARRFVGADAASIEQQRQASFFAQRVHAYYMADDRGQVQLCGAGATITLQMTVPGTAYFVATHLLDDSDGAYRVSFAEGTAARAFMDRPMHRDLILPRTNVNAAYVQGAARAISEANLRRVPWSQAFAPGEVITFTITDISAAPNDIRLALGGVLVYVDDPTKPLPSPEAWCFPQEHAASSWGGPQGCQRDMGPQSYQTGAPYLPGTAPVQIPTSGAMRPNGMPVNPLLARRAFQQRLRRPGP